MSYTAVPNDVEAAPVPTLHELQCELGKLPVESTAPAPVAEKSSEVQAAATATATIVSVPVPASSHSRHNVQSCCCGCSLATGIRVMSYLDLVHAFSMYIMAAWFLWLKINEGRVDSMLKNQLSADETASADEEGTQNAASVDTIAESAESEDGQDTEGTIEQINSLIDFQTYMIPFYVLFGVFLMHYARKGFKAANGDSVRTAPEARASVCYCMS
mmetsp:Transcript_22921/g.40938  ORF Transcript_22921/g.40938 Transcript_22921/m.40938 type:complete len:216 (+) Transcript_22921:50-697(+)